MPWTTGQTIEEVRFGYEFSTEHPWPDAFTEGGTPPFWRIDNAWGMLDPRYPQNNYFAVSDDATVPFIWKDYVNVAVFATSNKVHQKFLYGFKIAKKNATDPQYYMGVCFWQPYGSADNWRWAIFDEDKNFVYTPDSGNMYGCAAYYGGNYVYDSDNRPILFFGLYYDGENIKLTCPVSGITAIDTQVNITQVKNYGVHIPTFLSYCKQQIAGADWDDDLVEDVTEKSDQYGNASTPEGYSGGTFDDSSDTISIPTAPALGVSSTGFVNLYNPSAQALQNFGADLFPDLTFAPVSNLPTPSSPTEALENIATVLTTIGNQVPNMIDMFINSQLINYIVDCHIIPVAPTTSTAQAIKVGFKTFSQTAAVVTSDYIDFDCGSLNVGEYYANYIDYAPYTSAKLFLPFVGYVDILPEYWQSGTLSVTYRFNVIDGSFIVFVKSTSSKSNLSDTIIGQYGGNCCVHIPITGVNYANMVSGIATGAAAVISAGNANGGSKLLETASGVAAMRPNIQSSNGYNATTSFLSCRTPYLLIERSVASFSRDYAEENGLPSNVTETLGNLTGFTTASTIKVDISGATEAENAEIAALLAGGIYL